MKVATAEHRPLKLIRAPNTVEAIATINRLSIELIGDPMPQSRYSDVLRMWWFLLDGEQVAGYAGMSHMPVGGWAYLCGAGVLPKWQGRHLQRRLIRVRERAARKLGYPFMVTETVCNNTASINNLISCGYHTYIPAHPWCCGTMAMYWRKKLSK